MMNRLDSRGHGLLSRMYAGVLHRTRRAAAVVLSPRPSSAGPARATSRAPAAAADRWAGLDPLEPRLLLSGTLIAADQAAATLVPITAGDGVRIDVYNNVGGSGVPTPDAIDALDPTGATLSPHIDFPSPGPTIDVGTSFNTFFSNTATPPDALLGVAASNFTLDLAFFLKVTDDLDQDPGTPEIDLQLAVASDDGFHLTVGQTFIGSAGERGFQTSAYDLDFESEGLYEVSLLYAANADGFSGLELQWNTAHTPGLGIVPQDALYITQPQGQNLITFEEVPADTELRSQFRDIGVHFQPVAGLLGATDNQPDQFVPVTPDNVYGTMNEQFVGIPVLADIDFIVPGTGDPDDPFSGEPAVTDFVQFYLIDADFAPGAWVAALNPEGDRIFEQHIQTGGAEQRLVTIELDRISKLQLNLGMVGFGVAAIDNLAFNTPQPANFAPTLDPIADRTVLEIETVAFTANADDPDLPDQTLTFSLDPGAPDDATIDPATGQFNWQLDADVPPGDYPITIRVTDDGPGNLSASRTFTVAVEHGADLEPSNLLAPDLVEPGRSLVLAYDLTNRADAAADARAPWTDAVYLSTDDILDAGDTLIGQRDHAVDLAPGVTENLDVAVEIPDLADGDYWLFLKSDRGDGPDDTDGALLEHDESNNTLVHPIQVATPPTVVGVAPAPLTRFDVSELGLSLSAPLDDQEANDSANFRLLDLGADGVVGGGDDAPLTLLPSYLDGATDLELLFPSNAVVDLTQWRESDFQNGASGDWRVEQAGQSVKQYINGQPTFFVSDFEMIDSRFVGRMGVETDGDDDWMGLTFGFNDDAGGAPRSYYLLRWGQGGDGGSATQPGFTLERVEDGETSVVTEDFGQPWLDSVEYDFSVIYQSTGQIDLEVRRSSNQALVWDFSYTDPDPLGPGSVGFFNHSQSLVRYSGLQQADILSEGAYQLTAFSGGDMLRGPQGLALDGDGDGFGGDDFVYNFVIDQTGPTLIDHRFTAVDTLQLTFDEPVDPATFSSDDLALTLPDASPYPGPFTVAPLGDAVFEVTFDPQTDPGDYTLQVGPDLTDLAGNPMDADQQVVFDIDWPALRASLNDAPDQARTLVPFNVSVTVESHGDDDPLTAHTDAFYISDDPTLDPADALVWSAERTDPLLLGESYTLDLDLNIDNVATSGPKFLIFAADSLGVVPELDEADNLIVHPIDLTATSELSATPPALDADAPLGGQTLAVRSTIANSGPAQSPAVDVNFYLGDPRAGGQLLHTETLPALAPGDETDLAFDWDTAGVPLGTSAVFLSIDPLLLAEENDRSDNLLGSQVVLGRPAVSGAWTAPPQLEGNTAQTLTLDLTNTGNREARNLTLQLDLDALPPGVVADSVDGLWTWSNVGPSASFAASLQLTTPFDVPAAALTLPGTLTYEDAAGQGYDPLDVSIELAFVPDATPPTVSVEADPPRSGDSVTLIVDVDEPLLPAKPRPAVDVLDRANTPLSPTFIEAIDLGDGAWRFVYEVDVAAASEGLAVVTVDAFDRLNQRRRVTGSFIVDRSAPAFVFDINDPLGSGTHELRVTASETLQGPPAVVIEDVAGAPIDFELDRRVGRVFIYDLQIDGATAEGQASVQADGVDVVGNAGGGATSFLVDTSSPTISLSAPTLVGLGVFQLVAEVQNADGSFPEILVFDADDNLFPNLATEKDPDEEIYTYTFRVTDNTAPGVATIRGTIFDAALNKDEIEQTMVVDNLAPTLTLTTAPDGPDATLLTIDADEPLQSTPTVFASANGVDPLAATLVFEDPAAARFRITGGTPAMVRASALDLAGNEGEATEALTDLAVALDDVVVNGSPRQGNDVEVVATIHNLGSVDVVGVPVAFSAGSLLAPAPFDDSQTVSIPAVGSVDVVALWPANRQGPQDILAVAVDPDDALVETDETNNAALVGPVLVAASVGAGTIVLGDPPLDTVGMVFNAVSFDQLNGDQATVTMWLEDEDDNVVIAPWQADYDPVDERFESQLDIAPITEPGEYTLVTEASGATFDTVVDELPLDLIRDFTVTIQTDAPEYERRAPVVISGELVDSLGQPMANVPVGVTLETPFGTRFFTADSDADGAYAVTFRPGPFEAGDFQASAATTSSGVTRASGPADFAIEGMLLQPARTSHALPAGSTGSVQYVLRNIGGSDLAGLTYALADLGGAGAVDASLDIASLPAALAPGEEVQFVVELLAGQTPGDRGFHLLVEAANGATELAELTATAKATAPRIVFQPDRMETVTALNDVQVRDVTIRNEGFTAVQNPFLVADNPDWITISGQGAGGAAPVLPGFDGLSDEGFGLFNRFALIGRIGDGGAPFEVGSDLRLEVPAAGELQLRINEADAALADNRGELTVDVDLPGGRSATVFIDADGGWQSTGVNLLASEVADLGADGAWEPVPGEGRDADGLGLIDLSITFAPTDPALLAAPQPFDWTIRLTGSNMPDAVMFQRSWVVGDNLADAVAVVVDDNGNPVPDAEVCLYGIAFDPLTGAFPTDCQVTGPNGQVDFDDMPPGDYGYTIIADDFAGDSGSLVLSPGADNRLDFQLDPDFVSIDWVVQETTIPDRYDITLRTTYRTPPGDLDGSDLPRPMPPIMIGTPVQRTVLPGTTVEGSFTLQNAGELAAVNIVLDMPDFGQDVDISFIVPDGAGGLAPSDALALGVLLPDEVVTLDYRITVGPLVDLGVSMLDTIDLEYAYQDPLFPDPAAGEAEIAVDLRTPENELVIDPPAIYKFVTHGFGNQRQFIEDFDPITVTNAGPSDVSALSLPLGMLMTKGFGVIEIARAILSGGTSLVADLFPSITGVSYVTGAWDFLGGDAYLQPGESATTDLTQVNLGTAIGVFKDWFSFFDFDLVRATTGAVGFNAQWTNPATGNVIDNTKHVVPVYIMSVAEVDGGYTLEINLPDYAPPNNTDQPGFLTGGGGFGPAIGNRKPPVIADPQRHVAFELEQQASFDRQAFIGALTINNGSDAKSLEQIRVNIRATDEDGNVLWDDHRDADELFFGEPDLFNVSGVDGDGVILPNTTAVAEWLIIPTPDAGGRSYNLAVDVEWLVPGSAEPSTIASQAVAIDVDPLPQVELNYFIQPEFQKNLPFHLAVVAANTGEGPVHNLVLETKQPTVTFDRVRDADGVFRDPGTFGLPPAEVEITDAYTVGGGSANGFDFDFGSIDPGQTAIGVWEMTANPGGIVDSFEVADVRHAPELGGDATSLLTADADIHWIDRFGVRTDSDNLGLLIDSDVDGLGDTLFDVADLDNPDPVEIVSAAVAPPASPGDDAVVQVPFSPDDDWTLILMPDPYGGARPVDQVIDETTGQPVPQENVWVEGGLIHLLSSHQQRLALAPPAPPPQLAEPQALALGDAPLNAMETFAFAISFGEGQDRTEPVRVRIVGNQFIGDDAVAAVTVDDVLADLTEGGSNDAVQVLLTSEADPDGELITLTETAVPGAFRGLVGFEPAVAADNGLIHVDRGGLFTASYEAAIGGGSDLGRASDTARWATADGVLGRFLFFNNSRHDDATAEPDAADDRAIAPQVQPLLPGQAASPLNVSSFARGINGIIIDIDGLAAPSELGLDDFEFRVGNDDLVDDWAPGPDPLSIAVRQGAGVDGADRVTLVWSDGAIRQAWLQVKVLATSRTGLAAEDVFFFGNALGETRNNDGSLAVDGSDLAAVRDNPRSFLNPAGPDDPYDLNRDTFVDATDFAIVRDNPTNFLNDLNLIQPDAGAAGLGGDPSGDSLLAEPAEPAGPAAPIDPVESALLSEADLLAALPSNAALLGNGAADPTAAAGAGRFDPLAFDRDAGDDEADDALADVLAGPSARPRA